MSDEEAESRIRERRAEAVRILRGVAAMFSEPERWTQGAWARDADGMSLTRSLDCQARCWCLIGAIRKVRGPGMSPAEDEALKVLRSVVPTVDRGDETLAEWNDRPGRVVTEVRQAVLQAAENLEARL